MSALDQSISSDMEDADVRLLVMLGLRFASEPHGEPLPDPDNYILLDWDNLRIIPKRTKISEIVKPGIVLLLPNEPLTELAATVSSLKQWIMQGEMRAEVEKHPGQLAPRIAIRTAKPCLGSKERPFEWPQECISFLESDHPEKYVFRGQRREYDQPLLPSGYRRYFRPLDLSAYGGPPLVGVTHFHVEIEEQRKKEIEEYNRTLERKGEGEIIRGDGVTGWDVLVSPPQSFYKHLIKVPYERAVENQAMGEMCVSTLIYIFGRELGMILAQQYGLTSALLDATTDPEVALFFATHKPPYYWPVGLSNDLGVIYRWPRGRAIVGEDILKPLERKDFQSVGASFKRFVEQSKGLETWPDDAVWMMDDKVGLKLLHIVIRGKERALAALAFSEGNFKRSRMGRQCGAFLEPWLQPLELGPMDGQQYPQKLSLEAIGDLLKTHQGKAFYFKHSEELLDLGPIDKFYLWPIQEYPDFSPKKLSSSKTAPVALRRVDLQDKYFELLLLLLSPWSPVLLLLWSMENGKPRLVATPARTVTRTLIHPGFAIHPEEARTIAQRLLDKSSNQQRNRYGIRGQGPISFPISMLVEDHLKEEFYRALAESTREILHS